MNANFEAARVNVNFYLGCDLPHAREWISVTRESGQFAMAHQEPLFLHPCKCLHGCKYYFAEEMEINSSKVYKYKQSKGEFCVLLREVPSEVELYLDVKGDKTMQDGEHLSILVQNKDGSAAYRCKRPVWKQTLVATVAKQVAAALLDENKVTKQTKVRLTDRLGRKLRGNVNLVRKSGKKEKTVPK
jgi:hypothetical protein